MGWGSSPACPAFRLIQHTNIMHNYINIGSVPCSEDCAQVGSPDYARLSRIECRAFKNQLQREFPAGVFRVKGFPHDFGTYHEVVAVLGVSKEADEAAFSAEGGGREFWDSEAVNELEEAGYRLPTRQYL